MLVLILYKKVMEFQSFGIEYTCAHSPCLQVSVSTQLRNQIFLYQALTRHENSISFV